MWYIVLTVPHLHLWEDAKSHLCRFAAQRPWTVRKQFSAHHVHQVRLKPRLTDCRVRHDWLINHCSQLPSFKPHLVYIEWFSVSPKRTSRHQMLRRVRMSIMDWPLLRPYKPVVTPVMASHTKTECVWMKISDKLNVYPLI